MKRWSLKIRLLALQAVVIALALGITGFGLTYLFERHVTRRISIELDTYLTQIAARLNFEATGMPSIDGTLADPRFDKIYSGLYWQIDNETAKLTARSRSLWDVRLSLPAEATPGAGKVHSHILTGPLKSSLLVHDRRLLFSTLAGEQSARLAVALDRAELEKLSAEFAQEVAISLIGLGLFLLLAGWVQVAIGLSPLSMIQKSIAAIRNGAASRIGPDMPGEISPLAEEVNHLLTAQEQAILKARNRAGDLAHGFKTSLTALNADIKRLRDKGEHRISGDIEQTAQAMRRQIERELAKTRIREVRAMPVVTVLPVIKGIVATLRRTPDGETKNILVDCPEILGVLTDKDDLADIVGNLIENAVKHANHRIVVRTRVSNQAVVFEIEDDGPGISRKLQEFVQKRGVRLDQSSAGSGLGLAIVKDLLDAYKERLTFSNSPLGGLRASFQLPLAAERS